MATREEKLEKIASEINKCTQDILIDCGVVKSNAQFKEWMDLYEDETQSLFLTKGQFAVCKYAKLSAELKDLLLK